MNTSIQNIEHHIYETNYWIRSLTNEVSRLIVGQTDLIRGLILGLLCNGHILLEGVPGLAKTLSIKTLASCTYLSFSRIQFTPDLLPADLIGTLIYNAREGNFTTRKGPIFSHFVLADEVNRAPAKVQSALLEAMQEHQVTIGDETFALPSPFLVLATQNPLDQEGTYPLPEAQLDRFMFKIVVGYPNRNQEKIILDAMSHSSVLPSVEKLVTAQQIQDARGIVNQIYIDERVKDYILDIVRATREPSKNNPSISLLIRSGASPRATIYLALASKSYAFMQGRGYVTPNDVKSVAYEILSHFIVHINIKRAF